MLFELSARNSFIYRDGVADDVEIAFLKIYDFIPFSVSDVRIANVPFLRDCPVKGLGPTWHLMGSKWDILLENPKCLAHAVASDTAANGKQPRREHVHLLPDRCVSLHAKTPSSRSWLWLQEYSPLHDDL